MYTTRPLVSTHQTLGPRPLVCHGGFVEWEVTVKSCRSLGFKVRIPYSVSGVVCVTTSLYGGR